MLRRNERSNPREERAEFLALLETFDAACPDNLCPYGIPTVAQIVRKCHAK